MSTEDELRASTAAGSQPRLQQFARWLRSIVHEPERTSFVHCGEIAFIQAGALKQIDTNLLVLGDVR
jgi:hypothetical protein